jgi:hypothetical protein
LARQRREDLEQQLRLVACQARATDRRDACWPVGSRRAIAVIASGHIASAVSQSSPHERRPVSATPPAAPASHASLRTAGVDALSRALARAVLQRCRVDPIPQMTHQWRPGTGGFFDPNCGWYAEVAAMRQRAAARGMGRHFPDDPAKLLPKNTWFAFNPFTDGASFVTPDTKPLNLHGWKALLQKVGPVIVSGKLGGADWGDVGDLKLGIGHYVLIVGASTTNVTLDYMDPLQGDVVRTDDYVRLEPRINTSIAYIDDDALTDRIIALKTSTS